MTGEPGYRPHSVYYFGSKDEYVDYLTQRQGPDIAQSLGFYDPPKGGANNACRPISSVTPMVSYR